MLFTKAQYWCVRAVQIGMVGCILYLILVGAGCEFQPAT